MIRLTLWFLLLLAIPLEAPIMMIQEESEASLGYPTGVVLEAPVETPVKAEVLMRSTDDSDTWSEHECLSRTVYWESKGQGDRGMALVAQTTINRVNSEKKYFPNTICQVIKQRIGRSCAYSFYCDGKSDRPVELDEYKKAKDIAQRAINGEYKNLSSALYFKKCNVVSGFFNKLRYLGREKAHCYYTSE